ncbi:MAG: hypothetical protein Q4C03_00525 [bacterium]|nr:hypothetical protein [bacterium]MDO5461985.1 hypothetical protein [bacterium]
MKQHKVAPGKTYPYTPWNATRFFVPLCIQAMSQGLTYPLVGVVVAHGGGGALEFSAFSQGLMIMFLLGTVGFGLITTGMMYARDRIGYIRFSTVNHFIMLFVFGLQCLLAMPYVSTLVFGLFLGLDGWQMEIARWSMFWSFPAQLGFFFRNIPQVVLYNEHRTAIANAATILRIILTALLSPLLYAIGCVGWQWGCVALSVPVVMEAALMWGFARPSVKRLPFKLQGMEKVTRLKVFLFNIPLSLGGLLLMFAVFMLNAVVNRTANGEAMLAIHLIAIGLVNPLSYGAMRNQAVAIGFPQTSFRDQRTFIFALCSGIVLGLVLLPIQIPAVSHWYFCSVQNLAEWQVPLAKRVLWVAMAFPILQALRGHAEGLAAFRKRPNAVLAGQAVFFGVLLASLVVLFFFKCPGYVMGILSLVMASFATFLTIRLGLALAWIEAPPMITPHRGTMQ